MEKEFYNRKNELHILKSRYEKLEKGQLLVLFGRRRVGKTELVKEFMGKLAQKEKFYFYIDLSSKQELLNTLSAALQEQLGENVRFQNYEGFFEYIDKKSEQHRFLLVIDEFQRFLEVSPEFITKLQNRWDSKLRHNKLMIVLIGSSIGMMQKITESRAGALYGRATKIKISPFNYAAFRLMFKNLPETEKIERFAVFGGTPYYLAKTMNISNTKTAISQLVLKKGSDLAEEPKNLMEYENVRVHAKYNSILHSIASGKEILKEMEDFTKLPSTTMPAYLKRLDELLDLVAKRDPVLGKERLGRYAIKDNFFKFWYKYIFPNQTALNLGNEKLIWSIIEDNLNSYVGKIFEEIIHELFKLYLNKKIKGIAINFENIGTWWDRNGNEIDIVAYNEKEKHIYVGEIKWTSQPCGIERINSLIEKAKLLNYNGSYQYILVSKNGFTEECLEKGKKLHVLQLDLKEIAKLFDIAE